MFNFLRKRKKVEININNKPCTEEESKSDTKFVINGKEYTWEEITNGKVDGVVYIDHVDTIYL